jgi:hypothetical protein
MADCHFGRLTFIGEVLRRPSDGRKGVHFVSLSNLRPPFNVHVGEEAAPLSNDHVFSNDTEGPNLDISIEPGLGMDNR